MKKYARNATIIVNVAIHLLSKSIFFAKSEDVERGTRARIINCFRFVPGELNVRCTWFPSTINCLSCWNKEFVYIGRHSDCYHFRWLPVMGLFCRIGVES